MNMFGRYLETLCYRRSDGKQRVDFGRAFVQLGAPLIVAIILALIGVVVDEGSTAISFISIIAGLMCTVAALLFEARTSIMRRDKTTVENDERSADELFCLCIWLIFVGIVGTIAFLLPDFKYPFSFPWWVHRAYSFVCFAIILHFFIVVAAFATRFIRIYVRVVEHKE